MRQDVANLAARRANGTHASADADLSRPHHTPVSDIGTVDLALFISLLDNMMQGVAVFDADLCLQLFNRAYVDLFEFPEGVLKIGMPYEDILRFNATRGEHGDADLEAHVRKWLDVARNGVRNSRHEHVRPNGRVIALRRVSLPGGGFLNTYTDITQRKKAEADAARNATILQATIDNMADGVRVFDENLRLLAWNRQVFEMFDFPDELARVGTPYNDFLKYTISRGDYRDDRESLDSRLGRALNPTVRVTEQELPNGRILEKRRNPMPGGGFVSTYFDVTERKHAEQALAKQARELAAATDELKRSNAELQQFAYVASHDLQEPLRMVGSYCQLLQRRHKGKLGTDADEFIGFAVEGAKRMQKLINDLLLYSRVGTKGKPFTATPLEDVLANALSNLTVAIEEGKAEIAHDPLPTVSGDNVQLTQLFQNLIGNALKFHDELPVRIRISAERDGAEWHIRVQDNGIGIEPQYAERIFMIFQRLHTRQEYPGTGIGLSICKKIVERHGGRIWVEPAPGKGSIFNFTLPICGDTP